MNQVCSWPTILLHKGFQRFQCNMLVPTLGHYRIKHLTYMIHSAPKLMGFTIDFDEYLVDMPAPVRMLNWVLQASFLISFANTGPKRFHQLRTVS